MNGSDTRYKAWKEFVSRSMLIYRFMWMYELCLNAYIVCFVPIVTCHL